MRNLVRYMAVGLAIGLTASLVFASWVFAGSYGQTRSLERATPEILAEMLRFRSESRASLDQLALAFSERADEVTRLGAHLADSAAGFAALVAELRGGGAATADTVAALTAEVEYLTSLGDLLGNDPFNISQSAIEDVLRKNDEARALLDREVKASGLQVSGGDPLGWDPRSSLSDISRDSLALREAASDTDLRVTGKTQNSVTIAWNAAPIAQWSGIWITAGDGEPVFVTEPRYRIGGLDPLETIQVSGQLALGAEGRFRGPATASLEATSDHPPYAQAWLGNQTLYAFFRITGENYSDLYSGKTDSGSLTLASSCSSGACGAQVTLSGYDLATGSKSSTGQLTVSRGLYTLTVSSIPMGYYGSCSIYGSRTISFSVVDGAMINGVWTATALSGAINHRGTTCNSSAYIYSSLSASIYGD